ncbi:MAG: MerR family transcriptional regulator [Clostridium sp.]|uniref:MerR family transcriptional regulator n=1 Tax=Clostridium sp. TaxID=1506 RepID=UPI003F3B160E
MYTIKRVSEMTNISPYTIRYYDKEGLLPFITRTENGIRKFSDTDLEWLKLITCLKNTGMHIKDIKQYIDWYIIGMDTFDDRKNLLLEHRKTVLKQMEELQFNLDKINYKIEYYNIEKSIHPELKR